MSLIDILTRSARGTKVPQSFLPLLQQAISEAGVRYSPEFDQLSQVRQQSAQTMRQSIGQANSAAQLESALANESLRNLNANTNPIVQKAAQYQGTQGSTGQVGTGLALGIGSTSSLLAQAARNAPVRARQQGIQALATHQQDLDKINSQRAGLLGQAGTFLTGRYGDLVTTDRKNRIDAKQFKQNLDAGFKTAGINPDGSIKQGGPKDPAVTDAPSNVAKPPSNFTGSPADWNNLSRGARDDWVKNHPSGSGPRSGGKDQYGNSRDQRLGRNSDYRKVLTDATTIVAALKQRGKPVSFGNVYAGVAPEYGSANIDVVKGAVQQALGGVDSTTYKRLTRLGVHNVKRAKQAPVVNSPTVAPGPAGTVGARPT